MSSLESKLYSGVSPLNYKDWLRYNNILSGDNKSYNNYTLYVKIWYSKNYNSTNQAQVDTIRESYISFLKELSSFYKDQNDNLFIKDVDFSSETEIIYSIPFFVQKIKDIALQIADKRQQLKRIKNRYNSIGSNESLTAIIRDHILRDNTSNTSSIVVASLSSVFPEFATSKDTLNITIEELYDNNSYGDSRDESILFDRLSNNSLFSLYNYFINNSSMPLSSYEAYTTSSTSNIDNLITFNTNQLGTTVNYITASPYNPSAEQDSSADFTFENGNNWFYWPTGEIYTQLSVTQNVYAPIHINNSVLVSNDVNTIASDSYSAADLIFQEQNGTIKGAWLKGNIQELKEDTLVMTSTPRSIRSFIFPTPGYEITDNLSFKGRAFDDKELATFNSLDPRIQEKLYKEYIESPSVSGKLVGDLYINDTTLVDSGATAGNSVQNSDTLHVRITGPYNNYRTARDSGTPISSISLSSYYDNQQTKTAMLYRLSSTEIVCNSVISNILWPYSTYNPDADVYIHPSTDTCEPIFIQNLSVNKEMLGAVAGTTPLNSDVLAKLSSKNGSVIDAAWLKTGSVKDLAQVNEYSIKVYDTSAINCVSVIDGPVQPSLTIEATAGEKVSFIWCDVDTPADEVFAHRDHTLDCPYDKSYNYLNNKRVNSAPWGTCTCKALYYSPIGHNSDQYLDNNAIADLLYADPQNLGSNFNISVWKDTRGFNYKNSPQFAHFKSNISSTTSNYAGWSAGSWKTGNNTPFILKTGRRYTYVRAGIRGYNTDIPVPSFISYYPYKRIIGSYDTSKDVDIVFAIDISGSQFFSYKKSIELIKNCLDSINTTDSQVGVVLFSDTTNVLSYLTSNKRAIKEALDSISLTDTEVPTNAEEMIAVVNDIFTVSRGGTEKSLSGVSSNIDLVSSIGVESLQGVNIPKSNNEKVLVMLTDGDFSTQNNTIYSKIKELSYLRTVCVDIGPNSRTNNLLEIISSIKGTYINYENLIIQSDNEDIISNIAVYVVASIFGEVSLQPTWCKAYFDSNANSFIDGGDVSNMFIAPGDFLQLTRFGTPSYVAVDNTDIVFKGKVLPLIIKAKLKGWNYETNSYDGVSSGAKPYWGKVYTDIDTANNFDKYFREGGGYIRYINNYIPISHPEVSDIKLNFEDYIEYRNKGCSAFSWVQPINYAVLNTTKQWCKLKICTQPFNLKDLFDQIDIDKVFEQSDELSDIYLATYVSHPPAYYNYYKRFSTDPLIFSQPLNRYDKVRDSKFSQVLSGTLITPQYAHRNLNNIYYASIPRIDIRIDNLTSSRDVPIYMSPDKIGVPYILGKGHTNTIDMDRLSTLLNGATDPLIYLNPNMYTSNRGLTKQDQLSPYITSYVDNTWLKNSLHARGAAGIIIDSLRYQKFTPYHSDYEIYGNSNHGISRQKDTFQFWSGPESNIWNDEVNYPTNFRKEAPDVVKRTERLLTVDKIQTVWRSDVYGNDFSVLKDKNFQLSDASINAKRNALGELWVRNVNGLVNTGKSALSSLLEKYKTSNLSFYNALETSVQHIEVYNKAILIRTPNGVCIERYEYDYDNSIFYSNTFSKPFIELSLGKVYAGEWYFEAENTLHLFTLDWSSTNNTLTLSCYIYDIDNDIFRNSNVFALKTKGPDADSPSYTFNSIKTPIMPTYNKNTKTLCIPFVGVDNESKEFIFQINLFRTKTILSFVSAHIGV